MKARPACPACKKQMVFAPANPHRPFCSERCRLIDLQRWLAEDYTISEKIGAANEPDAGADPGRRYQKNPE